ncbi:hypothetical protein B0H21DRAFT_26283 [Amylocystis lapponica]|nr:hypothetical protein B0H21DRAFT_26283 [Amylocystis lapponica]
MEVVVSTRNVVEIAQETIQPGSIACEWQGCQAQLSSWKGLQEHLQLHLCQFKPRDNVYDCHFQRCAGRIQATLQDLQLHVDLSHLSRVHLPCPIEGCSEHFGRHTQLPGHLLEAHAGVLGKRNLHEPGILKPARKPFRRRYRDLADFSSSSSVPVHTILSRPVYRALRQPGSQTDSSGIARISRKWSRMTEAEDAPAEDDDEERAQPFGDLPVRAVFPSDYSVRRKPPEVMQLSRPQPLYDPPVPEQPAPISIGYGAFKTKYAALEQAGLIDGSGMWPDGHDDADDLAEE